MDYDAAKRRLVIGKGFVDNVTRAMRNYEISGKTVLDQWFSYRRRDRTKPMIGDRRPPSPLEKIQPDGWLAQYTEDLLNSSTCSAGSSRSSRARPICSTGSSPGRWSRRPSGKEPGTNADAPSP